MTVVERHKRELLHESEGARNKIPGERRPKMFKFKGGLTRRLKGANAPVPPTSAPPYTTCPEIGGTGHVPPGEKPTPVITPPKEPIP